MQRELEKVYELMLKHSSDTLSVTYALNSSKLKKRDFIRRFTRYREAEQEQMTLALFHEGAGYRGCIWKPGIVFGWFVLGGGLSFVNDGLGFAAFIIGGIFSVAIWNRAPRAGISKQKLTILAPLMVHFLKYANPEKRASNPPQRYIADAHDAEVAAADHTKRTRRTDSAAALRIVGKRRTDHAPCHYINRYRVIRVHVPGTRTVRYGTGRKFFNDKVYTVRYSIHRFRFKAC